MKNLVTNQTMTSREIADLAGKNHKNVLTAIRSMEDAWKKITGLKFKPSEYTDATGRTLPMYELTRSECLYIATKFNDEARAKLIIRWEELETKEAAIASAKIRQMQASAKRRNEIALRIHDIDGSVNRLMSERKSLIKERSIIDNQDYAVLSFPLFPDWDRLKTDVFPNKTAVMN
ncbi:MAG: Rha family transcriptional regulator [Prevotellaceae bacterium]|jgi:Rha family phage regulatory protein|nr:Rha family transcriptional regulator [Prevotellaceae bacterium]